MTLVLSILGSILMALAFVYKVNYTITMHTEDITNNILNTLKRIPGVVSGIIYLALINVLIYVLNVPVYYLIVLDLFLFLVLMSYVDIKWKIIPNQMNLSLLISQLAAVYLLAGTYIDILNILLTVILGVALTYLSYKTKEEIGMGDVKMLVVINCIFGLSYVLYTALFGMFIILLVVIPCLIARKMNMKTGIPFVPFYLVGTIVYYILSLI